MVETAGTKLRRARKLRQLNLDDASRATKIRANQLESLEADDYTNFANLAYARSFLVGYAKFLHVDVRPYLDTFSDASTFGLDDYQYLSEKPVGVYRVPTRPARRRAQRGQLVLAGATLGLVAIAGFLWFATVSYQRLGPLDKLAAHQAAQERAMQAAPAASSVAGGKVDSPADATTTTPVVLPASAPADAPDILPVAAPVPDATAAPTPVDDNLNPSIPALAVMQSTAAVSGVPALPLPDNGNDVRQILAPAAVHATAAIRRDDLQPQKVVNNHPRE